MSDGDLLCTTGRVLYLVVKQALRGSGITFIPGNSAAVLVWSDTVKIEYFKQLHPWQVINRLPWALTMCRKAPFVRLIQRIEPFFPDLFTFLPKSYVLPLDGVAFNQALQKQDKTYIYKPDKGSLGHGIRMIPPGSDFRYNARLAVAQEYIESFTIDDRKFDLRVYALICSLDPLSIYIYRGGVARFCTESAEGDSRFSVLTNTAVNCKNPNLDNTDKMTRMISDVFKQLSNEGYDIAKLWRDIDQAIVLSLISAYGFLKKEEDIQCPNYGISRCFQIIGCDVLLDKNLHPYILEINYRPSLKCNTENSHDLKLDMLKDALKIAAPLQPLQNLLDSTNFPKDPSGFTHFLQQNKSVINEIEMLRQRNEIGNGFEKVFPNPKIPIWNEVLKTVKKLPTETMLETGLPLTLDHDSNNMANALYRKPQKSISMKDLARLRTAARKALEKHEE
ncbi:Tubulin-tyrosine ligase family protein [Tritrichomonas foetus]|uniref:Tubulin-tyrosine ligase family protein n=1 Tax=Tritrichomonas foetus TaxID=1144522 RepID=A0A1J4JZG5_9EUKA|nr:Tubulin-tyrosine ligase family protein [Tritrichomonas foetus]|eukprot:OHT02886.1 Tubulin-tyrosine ligase family protein [Tritrichomonas foetus]